MQAGDSPDTPCFSGFEGILVTRMFSRDVAPQLTGFHLMLPTLLCKPILQLFLPLVGVLPFLQLAQKSHHAAGHVVETP